MKTSQMHVHENVAGALIYALVLKGQVQQAEAVAKTFSATLNEIALQSAIADGLIKTGQFEEAIDKVSSLASSSKIQYVTFSTWPQQNCCRTAKILGMY